MGTDNIKLNSGQLYFIEPDGSTSLLGHVIHTSVECPAEDNDISEVVVSLSNLEASFTAIAKVSKEAMLAITGLYQTVINCCPDRRVAHLAVHGKTARIRRKNFNRAIRILEKEK